MAATALRIARDGHARQGVRCSTPRHGRGGAGSALLPIRIQVRRDAARAH
jgi:hypothetical protein